MLVVLYLLELQMTGVILLSAMAVGGFSLWLKRRKTRNELDFGTHDKQEI